MGGRVQQCAVNRVKVKQHTRHRQSSRGHSSKSDGSSVAGVIKTVWAQQARRGNQANKAVAVRTARERQTRRDGQDRERQTRRDGQDRGR